MRCTRGERRNPAWAGSRAILNHITTKRKVFIAKRSGDLTTGRLRSAHFTCAKLKGRGTRNRAILWRNKARRKPLGRKRVRRGRIRWNTGPTGIHHSIKSPGRTRSTGCTLKHQSASCRARCDCGSFQCNSCRVYWFIERNDFQPLPLGIKVPRLSNNTLSDVDSIQEKF